MTLTIVCECGETLVKEHSFRGGDVVGWREFWKAHGHFPGKVTFCCCCGSKVDTGPKVNPDPLEAHKFDTAWADKHAACVPR